MRDVILASASPRRRELLAALIDEFDVVPSEVEEQLLGDGFVDAERLAFAKAENVLQRNPEAIVVGSDTIVFDDAGEFGKPSDRSDTFAMWQRLRGRWHSVATSIAVIGGGEERQLTEVSEVRLRDLSDNEILAYIASNRPLDKAGGYAIQDEDVPTVAELEGCYCSVMGLPLWSLRTLLEDAGVPCREPSATFDRCVECPCRPPDDGNLP